MERIISLRITDTFVDNISKMTPVNALKELIWNSCDADANNIDVVLKIDNVLEVPSLYSITVKDDGHGIDYEQIELLFGSLGYPSKKLAEFSPAGRVLHGKNGQGRYGALSIGNNVIWDTIYKSEVDDKNYRYTLSISQSDNLKLTISDKVIAEPDTPTGTSVTVKHIVAPDQKGILSLCDKIETSQKIVESFAPYLFAYPQITINYANKTISPQGAINKKEEKQIVATKESNQYVCDILAIKWHKGDEKLLYFCNSKGIALKEIKHSDIPKGVSVYMRSDYFLRTDHPLDFYEADDIINQFIDESLYLAKNIETASIEQDAVLEIERIRSTDLYPYDSSAETSLLEKAQREAFDFIAVKVNEVVPQFKKSNKETQKLTYQLLKTALETNPSNIRRIFTEVYNLSPEKQQELVDLLEKTSLAAIINTASLVSDRWTFLNTLTEMVYDTSFGDKIKERTQFHKMLVDYLWLFGEQYTLANSDQSLKQILLQHIRQLGRDSLEEEITEEERKQLALIPDLCLASQICLEYKRYENIVIELKKPTLTLGEKEVSQIENYARTVIASPRFDKEITSWNFILIGMDYDASVKFKIEGKEASEGNIYDHNGNRISVYKWSEIIQKNKAKLEYLSEKLELRLADEQDSPQRFLAKKHGDLFPELS